MEHKPLHRHPVQPWFDAMPAAERDTLRRLKGELHADDMTLVRTYIEASPSTIARTANAKLIAHLLSGHGPIASVPCPIACLIAALRAWHEREAITHYKDPSPGTLITLVDECWDTGAQPRVAGQAPEPAPGKGPASPIADLPLRTPPRTTDRHAVWVVSVGMVDYTDPRHPARGLPESAVLVGQLYRLPKLANSTTGAPR